MKAFFQRVYGQLLVTFEHHQIVSVALVVTEEKVLAVSRVNLLPVLQCHFYGRERGMIVCGMFYSVFFEEFMYLLYLFVGHGDLCKTVAKIQIFLIIFVSCDAKEYHMGSPPQEGGGADSGGACEAVVHRRAEQTVRGAYAYDDERGRTEVG